MDEPGQPAVAQAETEKGALGLAVETVTPSMARDLKLPEPGGVVVRGVAAVARPRTRAYGPVTSSPR